MTIDNRVQAIFDKAMYLIDAQSDSTGLTMTNHTKEFQVRTVGILNTLLDLVYPASSTFVPNPDGSRPACFQAVEEDLPYGGIEHGRFGMW